MLPPKSHHGGLNSPKKPSPSSPPSPRPSKIASFRRRFAAKPPPDGSVSPDRSSALMRIVSPCWKPPAEDASASSHAASASRAEGLLWYKDLGRHAAGEFSMATAQANNLMEDVSQIESGPIAASDGPAGAFVGVYDGHGGPETSRYVADNLFGNIRKFAAEHQGMSPDVIRKAYAATEEGFISIVRRQWIVQPQLASVGACCLIGVVFGGMLYIANVGDSRAVLGRLERGEREVTAVQMSAEHNASIESVRDELRELHPDDSQCYPPTSPPPPPAATPTSSAAPAPVHPTATSTPPPPSPGRRPPTPSDPLPIFGPAPTPGFAVAPMALTKVVSPRIRSPPSAPAMLWR